jgi:hypothetical protein
MSSPAKAAVSALTRVFDALWPPQSRDPTSGRLRASSTGYAAAADREGTAYGSLLFRRDDVGGVININALTLAVLTIMRQRALGYYHTSILARTNSIFFNEISRRHDAQQRPSIRGGFAAPSFGDFLTASFTGTTLVE